MTAPIPLPPLAAEVQAELCRRYEETGNPQTRTRYQMVLLAQRGQTAPQIAHLVLRSEDTVEHVFKRFLAAGLDAVPRRYGQG